MPTIILPVETLAREWDAKLLLAAFLARSGAEVIIGSHARINARLHRLPADVYVSQTIVKAKRRIFRIIRALGMHLAAWDEEGMVWSNAAFYRNRRLDSVTWPMLERFFAWGEQQAQVIRETFPDHLTALRVAGNPRQDLYTPALRPLFNVAVERIRRQYGRMILINSNFGSLNHARYPYTGLHKTPEQLKEISTLYRYDPELVAYRYQVFLTFCDLVPRLAREFPERTILIRPHPSENPAAWEELAAPFDNVVVRYDHELIPWLLAADAVIHNGCTTAVETAMLGRAAIEYRKADSDEWVPSQPRAVSVPAFSEEEVTALLRNETMLQQAMQLHNVQQTLREIFHGWGDDELASERLVRELLALASKPRPKAGAPRQFSARKKSAMRGMEKALMGRLFPKTSANPAYISRKFPALPTRQVRQRLHELASIVGLPHPRVEQLHDRIWRIMPAGSDGETS